MVIILIIIRMLYKGELFIVINQLNLYHSVWIRLFSKPHVFLSKYGNKDLCYHSGIIS